MLLLDVFVEGVDDPVGLLTRADSGETAFRYLQEDLPHPVSLSLPIREEPFGDVATRAFFSNLLFENAQRDQVMARHGIAFNDVAGLLAHLGRDCPGALSVVPQGEGAGKHPGRLEEDYDPLSEQELGQIMISLRDHRRLPDDTDDPSPLAGVQGKLALTRLPDGRLALPRQGSGAPTTHILKVPRANEDRLVDHEKTLMDIAAGLIAHPVAETEVLGEEVRGLLITRFDRTVGDGAVRRLHQEDFCQALGLGPELKYQRSGGPAGRFDAAAAGAVIRQCDQPGAARQAFLEATLLNLLLGNTDNHAKNHALLYQGPRPAFAPLYDIVPVVADDTVTHQLSFDIGAARVTDEITRADLEVFAQALGLRRLTPAQIARLRELVAGCAAFISDMHGPRLKRLGDVISQQARALAPALGGEMKIPVRDLVVVNRPD